MPSESKNSKNDKKGFKLHIGPAMTPKEAGESTKKKTLSYDSIKEKPRQLLQKFHKKEPKKDEAIKEKKGQDRIWNILRYVSTSAIIFIILFFAMNWNAYQSIILNKLGFIEPARDYIEEQLLEKIPVKDGENGGNGSSQDPQELMDLSKDPEVQKYQIPELALEVYPPDTRIVIPRINKNVPVVTISTEALVDRDWDRLENEIQGALQDGVVHYPGTAFPDEEGNIVITGHSSYFVWDPGRFKGVFALLHDVRVGDKVYMYYDQDRYTFEVYETKVVLPTQVDVLRQEGENRLTLITCTPVGTNLKRLIVLAKPV